MAVADQAERNLRDRAGIGEPPILVASCRKADLAEASKTVLAKLSEPGELVTPGGVLKSAEALRVFRDCLVRRCHSIAPHVFFAPD